MSKSNILALVLAAGQGKRMNSNLPKVAHILVDKPLISWVIQSLIDSNIKNILPVIAPSQKLVQDIIEKSNFGDDIKILYAYQQDQLGTAHAVQCGINQVANFYESQIPSNLKIIVAYGDTPAIKSSTFNSLLSIHEEQNNVFTILAFKAKNPYGYGRIILNSKNQFVAIREQKDCSKEEELLDICNSGILCANFNELQKILPLIKNNNLSGEFYLTDIPFFAEEKSLKIGLVVDNDENQFLGINTQDQLKNMEKVFRSRL